MIKVETELDGLAFEWSYDYKRKARLCQKCKLPTRMRFIFGRVSRSNALCMECGMGEAFRGLIPPKWTSPLTAPSAVREIYKRGIAAAAQLEKMERKRLGR